jgi:hypothetical protein
MLLGWFEQRTGRPFVEAHLWIPRLHVFGTVNLLVDTGADASLLTPDDGDKLRVNHDLLTRVRRGASTSGPAQTYVEPAELTFMDQAGESFFYRLNLDIAPSSVSLTGIPSILGRDYWTGGS